MQRLGITIAKAGVANYFRKAYFYLEGVKLDISAVGGRGERVKSASGTVILGFGVKG